MALSFPLSAAAFWDLLRIDEGKFMPRWHQEGSDTAGGEPLYADLAPMSWDAEFTTVAMEHAEAASIMALINSLAGGLNSFLAWNPTLPYPSSDPTGSIFGAATPVLGTITNRLVTAFTGFPAGYVVPRGTYFGVLFDTSRRYFGQFAEDKTADGSGAIMATSITPALPASISAGAAVTISKPVAKFRMVPNSAYPSFSDIVHERITLTARQTYAAG